MNYIKKNNTILLSVITVASLLVAVVGVTYAYFTASVSGTASSVIVNAQNLAKITYSGGSSVSLQNALPGAVTSPQTITVQASNNGTSSIKYTLKWKDVSNGFNLAGHNDIVYTLKGTSSTGSTGVVAAHNDTTAPTSDSIIGSGTIKPGEKHTYTLTVKFKETGSDQNSLQGKTFSGKIEVIVNDANNNSVYYNSANPSGTSTKPSSS